MTWDEMIAKLWKIGVRQDVLPLRGRAEARLGLRQEGGRFIVSITERARTEDMADFGTEEAAVDFIYDSEVFAHRLNGDTRFDKWNANPRAFPPPRAETFGGRTLQR